MWGMRCGWRKDYGRCEDEVWVGDDKDQARCEHELWVKIRIVGDVRMRCEGRQELREM